MKQLFLLLLLVHVTSSEIWAQLGDFSLNSTQVDSPKRHYTNLAANPELNGGLLKNIFIGKNYRREWTTPVLAPVLNFNADLGGITLKGEGGGRQTQSLKIEDGKGNEWSLRSVEKYPASAVMPALRGTIAERIVADGISASYPYAVLSVGALARQAGVPYLPNTLVVIPDDPKLDSLRDKYKNTLALLEKRTIDAAKGEETYNTYEVIPKLLTSGKNKVDQVMVLKARLLDNFIMDFDRHADQWEWVKKDSGNHAIFYPVPKDRDQAFFRIKGILPKVAMFFQPTLGQLQGFRAKAANIKTFNFVAKDFDRSFLHELNEQDWIREVDAFLSAMTDSSIELALRQQPDAIEALHVTQLIRTLKEKRRYFKEDMLTFYRFLSSIVSIPGTNEVEQFQITKSSDGKTLVEVRQMDSSGRLGAVLYQRSFSPAVTKELRLYGLEGADQFLVRDKHDMTIRLIGGPGNDRFESEGAGGDVVVYDATFEENTLAGSGLKNKMNNDPLVNEYQRLGFQYGTVIPGPALELTREGGLFLGAALRVTTPGFRKEPYAASHFFYLTRAIHSPSWHARYEAAFIGIAKKTDLLIRSEAILPTVRTYFFGYGNNSVYNKSKGWENYLANYRFVDVALQARYSPLPWLQVSGGPLLQYMQLVADRNKGHYINTLIPQDDSDPSLHAGYWYGGAGLHVRIDRRNHPVFTTSGIHTNLYTRVFKGLSLGSGNFRQFGGNISFFTDFLFRRIVVLATSFGADRNLGDFAFPQAQYLGFRQNLRGYRFQRFAGSARAYNNTEMRLNLGVRNFYLFKGAIGLIGFHDVGRVWADGENSNTWHRGWGGGVWVAPFNQIAIIATLASSVEENSWLQVSFGFQF